MGELVKAVHEFFEDIRLAFLEIIGESPKDHKCCGGGCKPKRKRARTKDGRFRGDDKSTPDVNEAWENE